MKTEPKSNAGSGCPATTCSPSDLLTIAISELRAKHAAAESRMFDGDLNAEQVMEDFNIHAFNSVLFVIDQLESKIIEARNVAAAYRDDRYFDTGDMVRLPWESSEANAKSAATGSERNDHE